MRIILRGRLTANDELFEDVPHALCRQMAKVKVRPPLDQKLGEPALILVNGKEVAKGELVVLDAEGGQLGITIAEVTGGSGPGAS